MNQQERNEIILKKYIPEIAVSQIAKWIIDYDFKLYALNKYLQNPAASSCSDKNLYRALKLYDENIDSGIFIEKVPLKTVFHYDGKLFEKGERIRTRYQCKELKSGKTYLFHALAEVQLFEEQWKNTTNLV